MLLDFPASGLSHLLANFGVVEASVELLCTDTYGECGNVAVAVAAALPTYQGAFGNDVLHGACQTVSSALAAHFFASSQLKASPIFSFFAFNSRSSFTMLMR